MSAARSFGAIVAVSLMTVLPALAFPTPGTFSTQAAPACSSLPCLKWTAVHDGPQGQASATNVALSPDGTVAYVVGGYYTDWNATDLVVSAYAVQTGTLLWSSSYDGPVSSSEGDLQDDLARLVAVSPDGTRVVAVVESRGQDYSVDLATLVFDAASGAQQWVQRYNGGAFDDDHAAGLAIDATGGHVVIAGNTVDHMTDRGQWSVFAYSMASGELSWSWHHSNPCNDARAFGAATASSSPDVFIGGFTAQCQAVATPAATDQETLEFQLAAAAVDPATGAVHWWTQAHDLMATGASVLLYGEVHAAGSRVFVTGGLTHTENPLGDFDAVTLAVDTAGHVLWRNAFDTGGADFLSGAVASPDGGRLYLVVHTFGFGGLGLADDNEDLVALAYDGATGATLWTARFDSSTDGVSHGGRTVMGTGRDDPGLGGVARPVLIDGASKLAFAAYSQVVPVNTLVGQYGEPMHHILVYDTATGQPSGSYAEDYIMAAGESTFAAIPGHPDFVGVGWRGAHGSTSAQVRHFTIDTVPPQLALPADMVREASSTAGATVTYAASATDAYDGPVTISCTPASGASFSIAATGVTCQSSDISGNVATGTFHVTVRDSTPPALTLPTSVAATATSKNGAALAFSATALDLVDGSRPVACSPAPGSQAPLGPSTLTCQASDLHGNTATGALPARVTYSWSGFGGDVQQGARLRARDASVTFQLTGASAGIHDAHATLWVAPAAGGPEVAAVARHGMGNTFQFNAAQGNYGFTWDTNAVLPGQYTVRIDLGDGTANTVRVTVK